MYKENRYNYYYVFEYPRDISPNLKYSKCNDLKLSDFKLFKMYEDRKEIFNRERLEDERLFKANKERIGISRNRDYLIEFVFQPIDSPFMDLKKFDFKIDIDKPDFILSSPDQSLKNKYKSITTNMIPNHIYTLFKSFEQCKIVDKMYKYNLKLLYALYDNLEIGGNYFTAIINYCELKTIEYIYLMSLLFEKIIIYNYSHIYGINYLGELRISKNVLRNIIKKNSFCIEPKPKMDELMVFLNKGIKREYTLINLLLKKKFSQFRLDVFKISLITYLDLGIDNIYILDVIKNYMKYLKNNSNKNDERKFIYKNVISLIKKHRKNELLLIKKLINNIYESSSYRYFFMEFGMGMGIYTKEILDIMNKMRVNSKSLVVIDPNQKNEWESIGLDYLKNTNTDRKHMTLITGNEQVIYDKLYKDYNINTFKLILIQNYGTYEKIMNDLNIALYFLDTNGYIIFERSILLNTNKIVSYIDKNIPFLERVPNNYGIPVYIKTGNDKRIISKNYFNF